MQHNRRWQEAVMNWRAIFSSAAGSVPRWGRPENFRCGPPGGPRWDGSGLGAAARTGPRPAPVKWFPSGRQMEGCTRGGGCVPAAQSAAPEESTSWALNQPESSGFCLRRSHQ